MNFHAFLTRAQKHSVFSKDDMATVLTNLPTIVQHAHSLKSSPKDAKRTARLFSSRAIRHCLRWIRFLLLQRLRQPLALLADDERMTAICFLLHLKEHETQGRGVLVCTTEERNLPKGQKAPAGQSLTSLDCPCVSQFHCWR